MKRNAYCLLLVLLIAATKGHGFTLLGGVLASTDQGTFIKLDPDDELVVGDDTFQDPNLYAFDEDQNIVLSEDLWVDVGQTIPKGTTVASHYIFFDPEFGTRQLGFVEFDSAILGIAVTTHTLKQTDFLANTSVTYLNPDLRGLEGEDAVWVDPDNPFRIIVDWGASSPGDYIRVFTGHSPGV